MFFEITRQNISLSSYNYNLFYIVFYLDLLCFLFFYSLVGFFLSFLGVLILYRKLSRVYMKPQFGVWGISHFLSKISQQGKLLMVVFIYIYQLKELRLFVLQREVMQTHIIESTQSLIESSCQWKHSNFSVFIPLHTISFHILKQPFHLHTSLPASLSFDYAYSYVINNHAVNI